MKSLKFTKMQGLGNDFIVIDDLGTQPTTSGDLTPEVAKKICDRRFGVGADQILWLRKVESSRARSDLRMEILNADGSVAEMCGNGIRAVALYLNRHLFKDKTEFNIETLAGIKTVQVKGNSVLVDMGIPTLGSKILMGGELLLTDELLSTGELLLTSQLNSKGKLLPTTDFEFFEVNVGNPHAVIFVDEVKAFLVKKWGPLIEKHPRFPNRTNVEFVEVKSPHAIQVRVWERGAGITLACGTGACAAAVASLTTGKVQNPVEVQLPGGNLKITWAGAGSSVMMEGPAEEVFTGKIKIE
ncbi:MAG: diaminopimelate epimerase [Bdellovibrionia bacterium]